MRLTVLELAARWGRAASVLDEVDQLLGAGPASDLVLLPEAALHGYVSPDGDFDLTRFAEPLAGPTATRAAVLARTHRTHLVAPLVLREGASVFNAIACFDPTGTPRFVYRKRHPWFPETWATAGPEPHPLVDIAGVTVTAAICFDVHFLADEAAPQLAAADCCCSRARGSRSTTRGRSCSASSRGASICTSRMRTGRRVTSSCPVRAARVSSRPTARSRTVAGSTSRSRPSCSCRRSRAARRRPPSRRRCSATFRSRPDS